MISWLVIALKFCTKQSFQGFFPPFISVGNMTHIMKLYRDNIFDFR
jgi:hypothetical protein